MAKANRHMMKKKQSLKSQRRRTNFVFAFLSLAVFFATSVLPVSAATGVMVGSDSLILGSGENIYYGAFSPSSNAGASGMLIQSPIGNNIFRLDTLGNVTATGTLKGMGGLCIGNDCRTAWDQIGGAFWNLNGSNLYASSTEWNLGIGTTNPISKLHVVGATGLINTGAIQFSALGGAGNVLLMADNAGTLYSTTTSAVINPIVTSASGWTANGTTVYKTDTNGNVGIGKTNPIATLDVIGLQSFQGTVSSDGGQLSTELATTASGSGWTGSSFDTGYTHAPGDASSLASSITPVSGWYYYLSWTVTGRTAGRFDINFGGSSLKYNTTSNLGSIKATSNETLSIVPTLDFDGTITLSVKMVSPGSAITTWKNSSGTNVAEFRSNQATNLFFGNNSGSRNISGQLNTSVGYGALASIISGKGNTAFGYSSSGSFTNANYTTAIGYSVLNATNFPYPGNMYTTAVGGWLLGNASLSGSGNTFIGWTSGNSITTGSDNISMGYGVLNALTTGSYNVSIGASSLNGLIDGTRNLALGIQAGLYLADGTSLNTSSDYGLYLGSNTKSLVNNAQNEIVIGYNAIGMGSNSVTLGNDSIIKTILKGNVGIGTTTPATKLDVIGGGSFRNDGATTHILLGGSGNVLVMADNAGGLYGVTSPEGTATLPTGTSGQTLRHNGTAWIANTNLYNNGTNVGIGTTGPGAKLDVASGAQKSIKLNVDYAEPHNTNIYLFNNAAGINDAAQAILFSSDSATKHMAAISSGWETSVNDSFISFSTTNDDGATVPERMRINRAGNVGIGTTNPTQLLNLSGATARARIDATANNGEAAFISYNDNGGWLTYSKFGSARTGTSAGINNAGLSLFASYGSDFVIETIDNKSLIFATANSEKMRITGAGNVGIGTTAPIAKLQVTPGATPGIINNGSTQLTALGGAGNVLVAADNTGTLYSTGLSIGGYWNANGTHIYNNNTGNVGIGVTNPGAKLEILASSSDTNPWISVSGGGGIFDNVGLRLYDTGTGQGNSNIIEFAHYNSGPVITSRILSDSVGANASGGSHLILETASNNTGTWNSSQLFLSSNGNVGVGTNTPGAKLDVAGSLIINNRLTTPSNTNLSLTPNGTGNVYFGDAGNGSTIYHYSTNNDGAYSIFSHDAAGNYEVSVTGTGLLEFLDNVHVSGDLGVGTTSPISKLHVVGATGLINTGITQFSALGGAGNVLVMADNTGTLYSSSTSAIITPIVTPIVTTAGGWTASGTLVYKTDNNGNVGIGVTNPQEKLEVSGGSIRINSGDSWKSAIIKDGNGATIFRGLRGNPYWSDNPANSVGFNVGSPGDNIVFTTANSIIAPRMMAHTSGFQVNGGAYNLASAPAGLFEVTNGATKLFDILSNGRVGISTTSPAAKLQIVAGLDPGFINSGSTQLSALGGAGNVLVAADNTGTLYSTGLSVGGYWTANGNHIYNNNSANVGIGATNPVQKLEVANGNIKLSANSYIQGNSAGGTGNGGYVMFTGEAGANAGYGVWLNQNAIWNGSNWLQPRGTLGSLMFTSNHHLGWSWRFAGAGGADGGNITPNEVANLNSSGRLQIDGVLNVDGTASSYIQGRVGITTTTPAAKLQIVAGSDPGFINSGSTQLSALGGAGNVLVAADNTGTLYSTGLSIGGYWNANGNHIYNNNSANVGIGTTTPTAKLEVFGDIKSSVVGSSAVFTAYNPGTNYPRALFKVGNSTSDINTGLMFAPEYTSAGITKPFSLEIYNNKFNADSSARMVGLGVYATYSSVHSLGPNGNSAGLPLIFSTQTYLGNNPAIYISNAAGQNVGIGTSNPIGAKLQVTGTLQVGGPTGLIKGDNYNNGTGGAIKISNSNTVSSQFLQFGMNASGSADNFTPSVTLMSSGNLGIGTTTPASKLHLVGATGFINTGVNQLSALANSGNVLVMADNNGVLYATSTAGFLGGGTSGSDYWALAGSSLTASSTTWNVGIGTTNPGAKLTLGNDQWFGAINAAGTATANMFKLNTNNQIEVGSPLLIGPLELAQDGGYLTFIDMPVTSAAASSTVQGYSLRLDGNSLLNLYSRSNGTGGVADLGVGIGITNPSAALHVVGSTALIVNGAIQFASLGNSGQVFLMADDDGNLYATSSPTQLTGNYLPLTGGTLTGDLNMSGNDIDAVNKLTVNTIDPLYKIKGINYSTFVASVVGGVKEEYIGRAELKKANANGEYEQVIDFAKQKEGSDLWVWRKVVDFSRDNVDVLMTAYGRFAQVYYLIDGEKLIFRSDKPTVVSYRLVGQRIDWRSWPTRAIDQQETPGFIID